MITNSYHCNFGVLAVRIVLLALLVFGAALPGMAPASADLLSKVRSGEPVTVGFTNAPPHAYIDDSGRLVGHGVKILRHALSKMGGGQVEGQILEFGALINGILSRRIDIAASGIFVLAKRCEQVAFTTPTLRDPFGFVVPEGNPLKIETYADLRAQPDATIAVTAGTLEAAYAREAGLDERQIRRFAQTSDAFLAVRTGRADAAAALYLSVSYAAQNWPEDYGLQVTPPIEQVAGESIVGHAAFMVHPDEQAFVEAVNRHIRDYLESPDYLDDMQRFGVSEANLPRKSTEELCRGG